MTRHAWKEEAHEELAKLRAVYDQLDKLFVERDLIESAIPMAGFGGWFGFGPLDQEGSTKCLWFSKPGHPRLSMVYHAPALVLMECSSHVIGLYIMLVDSARPRIPFEVSACTRALEADLGRIRERTP